MKWFCWISILCFCCVSNVSAWNVVVAAGTEECFFENVSANTAVFGSFVVWENNKINVRVLDYLNKVLYVTSHESEGSFYFNTVGDGHYTLCFQNTESIISSGFVGFKLHIGDALTQNAVLKHEHLSPVESAVSSLSLEFAGVYDEMQFLKGRELAHRDTNESTFSRVTYWAVFKYLLLIAIGVMELIVIRSLFEKKHPI